MRSNSSIFYLILLTLLIALLIFKNTNHSKSDEPIVQIQENRPNIVKESHQNIAQVKIDEAPQEQANKVLEEVKPQSSRESKIELYSDPLTDNKSYEWLLNVKYPELEQYYSSKDELISGILDMYPVLSLKLIDLKEDTILMIIAYPNTDFEDLVTSAPTGTYIFQQGRFHKSINDKAFDKNSLFCILKINYNPELLPTLKTTSFIKIKNTSDLLTQYPGYKGVRLISSREDSEEPRIIKSIDCLLPSSSGKSQKFNSLQVLHIAYSLGVHIIN